MLEDVWKERKENVSMNQMSILEIAATSALNVAQNAP